MTIDRDSLTIGLTGSFGSGCSTVRDLLSSDFSFKPYELSKYVKQQVKNPNQVPRKELQKIGNDLRKAGFATLNDYSIIAVMALADADKENDGKVPLVFDSIRNVSEVELFRREFTNFFLVAVDSPEENRWRRVEKDHRTKGMSYSHDEFADEDDRDKNEGGIPFGQQVQLCVDEADIFIRNLDDPRRTSKAAIMGELRKTMKPYLDLLRGGPLRQPTSAECYMNMAYSIALMSGCFKRQVGAVIVDSEGKVISSGCNENPSPSDPCFLLGECYKERFAKDSLVEVKFCPFCGKQLGELSGDCRCPHEGCEKNLYKELVRDKALSRCTALHAEERAIINVHSGDLGGTTLYTTTFPCLMCANKILETGIGTVYYVESYPDLESTQLLGAAKDVELVPFEGVKGRAYGRLFGVWRRKEEERIIGMETAHSLKS